MALKLKLDKDAISEILETKKDFLFIGILIVLLLYGGWFLYQKSSISVDDLIQEATSEEENKNAGGNLEKVVVPTDVVDSLLEKRSRVMYNVASSPFGSPQEQLRMREEVENTYNRGVSLFNAGEYESAIQQFDLVVNKLDVTESRIPYPIMPSEYKRRSQREYLKRNFDRMLTSAQNDIQEGDRFAAAKQLLEAEKVYSRSNKTLSDALAADPDGASIGADNLTKVKTLQQGVFQKWQSVQTSLLKSELQKGTNQAQQLLAQNDLIALLKSMLNLNQIQARLNQIDANFNMVPQSERNLLVALITQIQEKLKSGYSDLCLQADQQFQRSITAMDMVESKAAIQVMQMALSINPQDDALQQKISSSIVRRAELVIQKADDFIKQQVDFINQGQYEQFDAKTKIAFLDELVGLRNLGGGAINATLRNQITDRETQLKTKVRKPPELTKDYDFIKVVKRASKYQIQYYDKTSRSRRKVNTLTLSLGEKDRKTLIALKEVDSDGSFVILSKPGYTSAKVDINQAN